jgi:hypothetical protein
VNVLRSIKTPPSHETKKNTRRLKVNFYLLIIAETAAINNRVEHNLTFSRVKKTRISVICKIFEIFLQIRRLETLQMWQNRTVVLCKKPYFQSAAWKSNAL